MDRLSRYSFPAVIIFIILRRVIPQIREWLARKEQKNEEKKKVQEEEELKEEHAKSYWKRMKEGG